MSELGARTLGEQVFDLLPPAIRRVLSRCAVPTSFDVETYQTLLRGDDGPELAELVQTSQVKPLGALRDRYVVTDLVRDPALAQWWIDEGCPTPFQQPVPTGLAELAGRLAAAADAAGRPLDALHLEVLASPATAAATFERLFAQADDRHDLALCRALIDVLDAPERRPLLDWRLGRVRNDAALRLSSLSMWTTAFYESARYVARPVLEEPLEGLLAGRPSRVLQFYADGGMGKTMQVRWLIARRCARRGDQTVCARLDFDLVQPVAVARRPWLLLVEIAAQLDPQLPGAPFQEFLAGFGPYQALLLRTTGGSKNATALPDPSVEDEDEVTGRFLDVLRELPDQQRVLVVLDTMEEALGPAVDAANIVKLMASLLDTSGSVRVLLAGRWDLRRRLPQVTDLLPDLASLEVPPLSRTEQERYLGGVRAIHSEPVVDEIIRLSEGRPLTVANYANLVTRSDDVTLEVLRSFTDPGLIYALQRVVERIDSDQLQWLIRYGVVPRKLSFDFVRSVLPAYLRTGMAGTSELDDPLQDRRPHDRDRVIFRTGIRAPLTEETLRELWDRLLSYCEEYGWVSVQSDDRQVVAFRGEVLAALRGLLRPHPIYRELHARAAEFYSEASRDRPELRREVIYHQFQLDHDAGARAWHDALAGARAAGADETCLDLATDLLGRDYVDWRGEPLGQLSFQIVAEAQLERARAAAALAETRPVSSHPRWSDVEEGLEAAGALAQRDDVDLPAAALRLLRAQLLTAQGRPAEAGSLLAEHGQQLSAAEQAEAERTLGQSLAATEPAAACAHLATAYELARHSGERRGARAAALLLAETENSRSRYEAALAALDRARHDGVLDGRDENADSIRGWALLRAGRPLQAADVVRRRLADQQTPSEPYWHVLLAFAYLVADDPLTALDACQQAQRAMSRSDDAPAFGAEHAIAVRGSALSALLCLPRGTDDLLSAAAMARDLRNLGDAAQFKALAAEALIRDVGDLNEARQCLDEARELGAVPGSDGWLYTKIVATRLAARLGRASVAARIAGHVLAVLEASVDGHAEAVDASEARVTMAPEDRAEALLACIAVADVADLNRLLGELSDVLSTISPPSARLAALSDLRHVPQLPASSQAALDRLVHLVRDAVADQTLQTTPADDLRQAAQLAEALRVAGRRQDALQTLAQTWSGTRDPLGWWRWLQAMERLGSVVEDELVPPDHALDTLRRYPLLVAAYRITLAQRRLPVDGVGATEQRLAPVAALLSAVGRPTTWHARFALIQAELARRTERDRDSVQWAAEASRIYSRLGDPVARNEVAVQFELGEPAWHDDENTIELAAQRRDDAIEVHTGQANESTLALTVPRTLVDRATASWRAAVSAQLLSRGWWDWSGEVGAQLLPSSLRRELSGASLHGTEIRIVPRSPELSALPWELLRLDLGAEHTLLNAPGVATVYRSLPQSPREEAKVRALQIALSRLTDFSAVPDGYLGARTRDALRTFQAGAGLPADATAGHATWTAITQKLLRTAPDRALRVLILRPSADNELQRQREAAASGGDVVGAYLRAKARVQVFEDPTLEGVWEHARSRLRSGVDVVHLCATPRTTRGSIVLDFGGRVSTRGRSWSDAGSELSVTAVGELLSTLSRDVFTPSVIVDVPQPHTATETGRALLARNAFAYQLLRLARVPAIFATGLAAAEQQEELAEALVRGMTLGRTFPAMAHRVWDRRNLRSGDELRAALPFMASALFLQRPPVTMLPLTLA
jgi:Putative peptidoglycan binding domain